MADLQQKTTYTAAEVAILEETIRKQETEIAELKRKLEHMNEVFANAQRARFGQSSEKDGSVSPARRKLTFLEKTSSVCLTKRNPHRTTKRRSPNRIPFLLQDMSGKRNAPRLRC